MRTHEGQWVVRVVAAFLGATIAVGTPTRAEGGQGPGGDQIRVLPVQGNVYMLVGPSGNVAVQVGSDGVLLVDTLDVQSGEPLLRAIRELSDKPIRHIINTHVHADHTGGNERLAAAGQALAQPAGQATRRRAQVIAHLNVLNRMVKGDTPDRSWPDTTFLTPAKDLFFNGEAVRVFHQPAAHTDGDVIVFFRRSDVISTGDIFVTNSYPVVDLERGGSINGIIDALNDILDLTVPAVNQEGGTMVIPGHGRLGDEADVVNYRDMLTIVRDRIQGLINKGMSLAAVTAAGPTLDFDPLYGAETGSWTTKMFVEAVYRSLTETGH